MREVNGFLRGWAGYFRYGNSARQFDKISTFAVARLALFLAKRHKRSRAWGWRLVAYQAPDRLGLISLTGTVAAPRPIWDGGPGRTPPVKDVGEPCAGKPHARFDGRRLETEPTVTAPAAYPTAPVAHLGLRL